MKHAFSAIAVATFSGVCLGAEAPKEPASPISSETKLCLVCHNSVSPGIVADWRRSHHARVTPAEAMKNKPLERRVSAAEVPEHLANVVVGCAECHNLSPEKHKDTFEHGGERVHVVVTPADCARCHPTEATQYEQNLMSHAHVNLRNNPVFNSLAHATNAVAALEDLTTTLPPVDDETGNDSCFYCHGSSVEVKDTVTRDTALGKMEFPVLSGWPNQGVGRLNPDGTMGSCAACHTRHRFSIEMARRPHTCSECHKGPDVPAFAVYMVSKHGNLFATHGDEWTFDSVPWVIGDDLTAPTCATCHVSLTVTPGGDVVAERTHQMNDRLEWRLFGLIYAHPHPKSHDTTIIKNRSGLPLPTELTGEQVAEFVIDEAEQVKRRKAMEGVCLACHSTGWVEGQFARLENTVKTTNEMTQAATKVMLTAWEKGAARGLADNDSLFNEALEKKWVEQWLFFANSTRFASAMIGADYGVFANGRWYMSKNIEEMLDWLKFKIDAKKEEMRK